MVINWRQTLTCKSPVLQAELKTVSLSLTSTTQISKLNKLFLFLVFYRLSNPKYGRQQCMVLFREQAIFSYSDCCTYSRLLIPEYLFCILSTGTSWNPRLLSNVYTVQKRVHKRWCYCILTKAMRNLLN